MNKTSMLTLMVVSFLMTIVGCTQEQAKNKESVKKLTLAAYAGDTCALVYIADAQGFFVENGLEVTIKDYEAGKLATDALIEGEADISTGSEFVLVSNSFDVPDLRILGTIAVVEKNELISRRDKGIAKIEDVKGKKIGVTKKSMGEFYLGEFLILNSVNIKDIDIVDLKPSEIIEAIVNGEIDAGLTWNPNIYYIKKRLGEKVVSWPAQGGRSYCFILMSRDSWLKNNSQATERLIRSLVRAEQYIDANQKEAKAFVKNKFGYENDYMDYFWETHSFVVKLPQSLILSIEDEARWRISVGLTDKRKVPNYLNYIYFDGLKAVKPEAVEIIH